MNQLPHGVGVSLKPDHYNFFIESPGSIDWLEVHPENYMTDGIALSYLEQIAVNIPLSMHGVGMSLGSADGVSADHLIKLKALVERYQPAQVSEHLSWSHWNQNYFNDLLPLPYTDETLELVTTNIQQVQEKLDRTILIENPSAYIEFKNNTYSETEFLKLLTQKTGCGLLLDINNIFVSCDNMGHDSYKYLDQIPQESVGEIHLAGHAVMPLIEDKTIRVDDHGSKVKEEVWKLYEYFCQQHQKKFPTLIEWDTNIPEIYTLLTEAGKAKTILESINTLPQNEY